MELTGQALRLSRQGAQAIVEEVGAIVGQNINMMDPEGYVIASRIRSESARFMRGQENHQGASG